MQHMMEAKMTHVNNLITGHLCVYIFTFLLAYNFGGISLVLVRT